MLELQMDCSPLLNKILLPNMHMESLNYSSVVGMLLYLARHTCPDIADSIYCAAKYIFCAKLVYEHALKQMCCYLKATSVNGLIMILSVNFLEIDNCPDADFTGMYVHKAMDDSVKLDM